MKQCILREQIFHIREKLETFPPNTYKHLGLYCYRKEAIIDFLKLQQAEIEKVESLEQLRFFDQRI